MAVDFAARLKALRQEMTTFNVDGFIIPRADEHQGEYVAPHAERLAWATGFTGSAGFAIVLTERAAVFVDGRYTLQLETEVDNSLFDYRHMMDSPAPDWLQNHLKAGQTLAYDPWLHTGPSLHRLKKACEQVGAKLVPAPHNFVDAIWSDRPDAPQDPVYIHDLSYAGQAHGEKIQQAAATLTAAKEDTCVLTLPDSIAWLLNIRGSDLPCIPVGLGFATVHSDASVDLFMDLNKIDDTVRNHLGAPLRIHAPEALADHLDQLGQAKKTVRIEGSSAPDWVHQRLKAAGAQVSLGDDVCALPKACKNTTEQDGARAAHRRDGVAMVRFLHWLDQQPASAELNEWFVARTLDAIRAEDPLFVDYSFSTISGAGSNGAVVHYRVREDSALPLPENGFYLVDSGGQYRDGTTDITRTITRGTPTEEMQDRYTRVLKGHIALDQARFVAGTSGSQLDALARLPLWQAGLDYDHGTGHGVGSFLSVHEGPQRISKMPSTVALKAGMIISNEPGYYKTGAYGIRLENLVMVQPVTDQSSFERETFGFEALTLCPFDKKALKLDLLTDQECAWLDAYHQRVRDELSPLIKDPAVRDWLIDATSPLR